MALLGLRSLISAGRRNVVALMTIDHKTCGHMKHITLDGDRAEEMHSIVIELIVRWSLAAKSEANIDAGAEAAYRNCIDDLVQAMRPFEIEQ